MLLDKIIIDELSIGDELRRLLQTFKNEKTDFPFATLCVLHYKDYSNSFNQEIYSVAAAIELIILSFDIIDDLQDQDTDYIWTKTPALSLNVVLTMLTIASKLIRESDFEHRYLALETIEN